MTDTTAKIIRVRDRVYDTRAAALADGWVEAEYGWWVPGNGAISAARWGWIACDWEDCD